MATAEPPNTVQVATAPTHSPAPPSRASKRPRVAHVDPAPAPADAEDASTMRAQLDAAHARIRALEEELRVERAKVAAALERGTSVTTASVDHPPCDVGEWLDSLPSP